MIYFILQCFYFMLPAYFANMAPVLVKKINFLNYPVDFSKKINKKPLLGNHKTWRGLFFGTLAAIIITFVQRLLYPYPLFQNLSFTNYSNWITFGFLLGFGALFGDLVKSFFKRRFNIKPGSKFIPWDQLDYSLGALLFISIIFSLSLRLIITAIILNFFLHITANHLGYYLKIREVKW